jgi:hypothetical protein
MSLVKANCNTLTKTEPAFTGEDVHFHLPTFTSRTFGGSSVPMEHSHRIFFIAPRLLPYHLRIGFRLVNELQTLMIVLIMPVVPSGVVCQYSNQLGASPNNLSLKLDINLMSAYFEERFLAPLY